MRKIRFWGTRGSLPVALTAPELRQRIAAALRDASARGLRSGSDIDEYVAALPFAIAGTYGGHTSCVEIETGGPDYVLCDLGSGVRPFGQAVIARHGPGTPQTYHIFMSHVHWDLIMGLPFFTPAYIPGNTIRIHGGHAAAVLDTAFRRQQSDPLFPGTWDQLGANISFMPPQTDRWYDIDGLRVKAKLQPHPSDCYGYRFAWRRGKWAARRNQDSAHARCRGSSG